MANKQTIAQVEARKRKLVLRLRRDANELVKLEDQLKDMRTGKRKVPPPPGVKYTIAGEGYTKTRDWKDVLVRTPAPGLSRFRISGIPTASRSRSAGDSLRDL